MGSVGIIAFAFGQPGQEFDSIVGPSNEKITSLVNEIDKEERTKKNVVYAAVQWETNALTHINEGHLLETSHRDDPKTHYIDTKGVLDAALQFFAEHNVHRIVLVAHPLHLWFIKALIKMGVWNLGSMHIDSRYEHLMRKVPYDKSNENRQPWTRGPVPFVSYLIRALFTRKHGN